MAEEKNKPHGAPEHNSSPEPEKQEDALNIGGSDALDQIEEPGGLEVEDMPESNELQERRRKTKSRLN